MVPEGSQNARVWRSAVEVAGKTDLGCVRTNNEDNFGYDWRYGIYVVCDGMGGEAAGEVASKIAVDTLLEYFRQAAKQKQYPAGGGAFAGVSGRASALANAVQLANQAIRSAAAQDPNRKGMGSTIVAVLVEGNLYSAAHVGDSRIYLIRQSGIQQLTEDHSLVAEQVRRGLMSVEEAERSEMQNVIIRALGTEDAVEPDLSDLAAEPGDVLLLASDGLTRQVPDPTIRDIISQAPSLREACSRLIQAAKDTGGVDNITCLLLRFVEKSLAQRWFGGGPGKGSPKWQDAG